MERAGKTLVKMKLSGKIPAEDLIRAAWPLAVGKAITAHTTPLIMVRDRLVVEVEDALWQKQLFFLTRQILGSLRRVLGENLVGDIEFRIRGPQRRPPQQAETVSGQATGDDADTIEDPVLRRIYQQSRKRSGE